MTEVDLLVDYKGQFYSSTRHSYASMDIDAIVAVFAERGVTARALRFPDVDVTDPAFRSRVVLYQSSEDVGLHYKSYVEDVVLALQLAGARVVPRFECLRAHHNKVFMELLRDASSAPEFTSLRSRVFGTLEDFEERVESLPQQVVLKPASGSHSTGVTLARSRAEQRRAATAISRSFHPVDALKEAVKSAIRPYHARRSNHRSKFIAQPFVAGLTHDYKVLVYGPRVYVLRRRTRPNDFRASGSGLFEFPEDPPRALLDFAMRAFAVFDVPFLSMDIAETGTDFHVLEFQFLGFGNYTLEKSPRWFEQTTEGWDRREGESRLETVFVDSVIRYVRALEAKGVQASR